MQTESNQLHSFHYPEMHLRGEAFQLKDQGHEAAAADMTAAADALKKLQTAPLADAELAELADMEQQATPTPWTHWLGSGKIFYGEADKNKPGQYSPANLQLFNAEDYDREELDTEVEGFNIQPGLAEDDAAFVAAMRNALPGLLARLAALQAFKAYVHQRFDEANIDRHEEQNAINGCRVGKRFDDLERYMQLTDPQKTREALVAVANGLAEAIDNQDAQQTYEVWRLIAETLTHVDSSTISSLRMIAPTTVKGGQQDA